MTGKEIADKLRQALALMNDSGAHWTKGRSWDPETEKYCAIGAIRKVVTGDPYGVSPEETQTAKALAKAIEQEEDVTSSDATDIITQWNDVDYRQWPDIVTTFTKAAETAEAS